MQSFVVPAHQGAFLETVRKRSGNAVPVGATRNRARRRPRDRPGRLERPPARSRRGSVNSASTRCANAPSGSQSRVERREAGRVPPQGNAGPRRKRGRCVELTRRPRRSHPLGETEKRTKGGPEPVFSGRRSVGCAGYLTRESNRSDRADGFARSENCNKIGKPVPNKRAFEFSRPVQTGLGSVSVG